MNNPNWPPPPIQMILDEEMILGKEMERDPDHPAATLYFDDKDVDENQEKILARKISTIWHQTKMDYMDFRDIWIYQHGLCRDCYKELDFWNVNRNKNSYAVFDKSFIVCMSCSMKYRLHNK